jgi:hypothetical protein
MATKEELLELRKLTLARVEKLRRLGDHSAEAPDIRANAEAILSLIEDRLERR